jgi:hypothetical protein
MDSVLKQTLKKQWNRCISNEPWFDNLVQERNELMQVLKQEDPSFYKELLNSW